MRGLFITGTDTGVGKTQVAAALSCILKFQGFSVRPRKPVESGCRLEKNRKIPHDAQILMKASGTRDTLDRVCRFPLNTPLSPERAAEIENISIRLDDLCHSVVHGLVSDDVVIIEGAGGWYTPITKDGRVADLARQLKLPVLIVASDRLGAINHTILTVEAVNQQGCRVCGIVLNQCDPPEFCHPKMDNGADILKWARKPVEKLPYIPSGKKDDVWKYLIPLFSKPFLQFLQDELARHDEPTKNNRIG
jgi:dethiobiotin synthetase